LQMPSFFDTKIESGVIVGNDCAFLFYICIKVENFDRNIA